MRRRDFLAGSLAVGAAAGLSPAAAGAPAAQQGGQPGKGRLKLKYAPSIGQFKNQAGSDPKAQIQFAADEGFSAMFDNGLMGRPPADQEIDRRELAARDMTLGPVRPLRRLRGQELRHPGQGRAGDAPQEDEAGCRDVQARQLPLGARRPGTVRREPGLGIPDRQRHRQPQGLHRGLRAGRSHPGPRAAQPQGPSRALPDEDRPGL